MYWVAHAPANIALIKYMGKKDEGINTADNPSFSYTLNNLLSTVKLQEIPGSADRWELLKIPGSAEFSLTPIGEKKFLNHLARLKNYFNYKGSFLVQSANNFPHSSGMASSASSFAALTRCAALALADLTHQALPTDLQQALWSREGSGSSCRSFFEPWVMWQGDDIHPVELPYDKLIHQVILINDAAKEVSSSEAHQRVKTSPKYHNRSERVTENLQQLLEALKKEDWRQAYEISWREFMDMHELFASAEQPFSYMTDDSRAVLSSLQLFWEKKGDGPIITMDAGPNIHLLYRPDQVELTYEFKRKYVAGKYEIL
ncbi:MAG: diphosphomevalonate decarboxylase [Legionella sp. 40-6]|nr:diphosphomevalonate decarboxylase [Legionella sp.]OJY36658.1 MAG: diphosphomevalonate decarboxylase [Legionella sp. 40-6]